VDSEQIKTIRESIKAVLNHLETPLKDPRAFSQAQQHLIIALHNYDADREVNYKARLEPRDEDSIKVTEVMESVMSLVALEEVKQFFLDMKLKVETSYRQKVSLSRTRCNVVFQGNPGTGILAHTMVSHPGMSSIS